MSDPPTGSRLPIPRQAVPSPRGEGEEKEEGEEEEEEEEEEAPLTGRPVRAATTANPHQMPCRR